VWHDGKVVGWVTSGGFGHCVDLSLAQGYVPKELAADVRPGPLKSKSWVNAVRPAFSLTAVRPEGSRMCGCEGVA
jgi:dimethylglycine dehydrogenase